MLNSTLYLVGKEVKTGEYVQNASPCSMCKRLIINAGIKTVVCRIDKTNFHSIDTNFWIKNDDSLDNLRGY